MQQGPPPTPSPPRLRWRVVIHATDKMDSRGQQSLAWHLAECTRPSSPDAHCDIGRRLMATDGNPDGHCLIAGACPRCEPAVAAEAPTPPEPQAAPEPPLAEAPAKD